METFKCGERTYHTVVVLHDLHRFYQTLNEVSHLLYAMLGAQLISQLNLSLL